MYVGMTKFTAPRIYRAPELTLRPYELEDAPLLTAATNASYEHLKQFMEWATDARTEAETRVFIARSRTRWNDGEDFTIGCFSPDGSELLGGCGFHLREGTLDTGRAEMGMWVAAAHAGKGVGSAMLAAMLAWGFTEWPWRRLTWRCDVRNKASARVAEKNGMRLEAREVEYRHGVDGTLTDDLSYAILKREWRPGI